jgi:predicted molibdopterin-dependent oxidoreductase YjgC
MLTQLPISIGGRDLVIGPNTTACHPILAQRIIRAKENGAKLIVADPRRIQLSRLADVAVQHRLGSDVALLNGLMHIIIENGWQAADYIETRTEGFAALADAVAQYPRAGRRNYRVAPGDHKK